MLRNLHRQPGAVHTQLQSAVFGFLETVFGIVIRGKDCHPMSGGTQMSRGVEHQPFGTADPEVRMNKRDPQTPIHRVNRAPG